MDMPLLLRTTGALLMLFAADFGYCVEDNYMIRYACVDAKFREQVPLPRIIDAKVDLSISAIQNVTRSIPKDLRVGLSEAANLSITTTHLDSHGRIEPEEFYAHFVSNVGTELKRRIDIEACGQDLEDALYNVGINRYFSYMLGKGEMYQWFVQHGGPYFYPAWVAAVVALELTGRSPDLESWKGFHERHTVKFRNPS